MRRTRAAALPLLLVACGSSTPPTPPPTSSPLPPRPVAQSPVGGVQVSTDTPALTVQNAAGYDAGQALYTFRVSTAATDTEVATLTVSAGEGTTTATARLLRGALLSWTVTARSRSGGEVTSDPARFRLPPVECQSTRNPYAKSVVDWWVPACSLAENHYNDPLQALGAPNAAGHGPDSYSGFISLGDGGYVSVDMEGCAVDQPGDDVRVYQSVSSEPVTLYAASNPAGPWVLIAYRESCGDRSAGGVFSNHCAFDLASAGLEEARYFKIEDGELYPCPGDTVTEGADLDAVQILHLKP